MLQIDLIDWIGDELCCLKGKEQRHTADRNQNQYQWIGHGKKYCQDAGSFDGKAYHAAILQTNSTIPCLFRKGRRKTFSFPMTITKCLPHFFTVSMVFHFAFLHHRVKQYITIRSDPCYTAVRQMHLIQIIKIRSPLILDAKGDIFCLSAQFLPCFHRSITIHHSHDERGNRKHDRQCHQKDGTKNSLCHRFPPTL